MGGLTSPKGGATTTSTAVQQVPQYAQDAQQNTLNYGKTILGSVLNEGTPQYTQAGFNSDQSGAYDLTRYLAQQAFTPSNNNLPTNSGYAPTIAGAPATYAPQIAGNSERYTAQTAGPAAAYGAQLGGDIERYGAATNKAAQIGANDYAQFMNPYIQGVIDPAVSNLRRQSDINSAQIGAQGAASGSFGGSRDAIRQGQNTRALGEQTSQMVSQLMSAGFDKATANAMANTQMQQQSGLANQAAQNTASQFGASANNQMAQFNAGAINQAAQTNANAANQMAQYNSNVVNSANQTNANANNQMAQANAGIVNSANQYNANAANTMAQANAGILNNAGQFNATQGMQAAQIRDALASSDQTRKMQAIQALLGIGNAQQTTQQNYLNQPLAYLQALAGITPQNYGGTTTSTQPNTAASPLQTLLGLGTTLGAAALK